jgi:hypothetical protein
MMEGQNTGYFFIWANLEKEGGFIVGFGVLERGWRAKGSAYRPVVGGEDGVFREKEEWAKGYGGRA